MLYIYGAGKYGKQLVKKIIEEGFREKLGGIIDRKLEGKIYGIEIIDYSKCELLDENCEIIISLADRIEAQKIAIGLNKIGKKNIYFLDKNLIPSNLNVFKKNGEYSECVYKYDKELPELPYLEFQVADECNLKCKSCAHFSNLVNTEKHASLQDFEKDMNRLSVLFRSINEIRLMGGEPLLNKQLPEFAKCARKIYPYSRIAIVTNGILIKKLDDLDWEIYRKNGIEFDITQYPPMRNEMGDICLLCREKNIKFQISPCVTEFFVNLSRDGKEDYLLAYNHYCLSKQCHFLRKGKMYICPRICMAYENDEFLKLHITEDEINEASINIYSVQNGYEILEKLYSPFSVCRICTKAKFVKWEKAGKNIIANDFFSI